MARVRSAPPSADADGSFDEAGKAVLLQALASALAGERPLLGESGLFPETKAGKAIASAAVERGYLSQRVETIPPATRKGKPKEIVHATLTDVGRQHLLASTSAKATLEALLPAVEKLAGQPSAPPDLAAFRQEADRATKACLEALSEAHARLQASVETALKEMQRALLAALPAGKPADAAPVLAALREALARAGSAAPPTPPVLPKPAPAARLVSSPEPLRKVLREAYDELCLYREFQDRLVEIPRLYHEAATRWPGLTAEQMHHELEAMSRERLVDLQVLNEVRLAKERPLAIDRDGRLYYYVFWK